MSDLARIGDLEVKIVDPTTQTPVNVDSQGHINVSGKSAVGVVPSSNPISISGVDVSGYKRAVLTDASGRLQVAAGTSAAVLNIPIQLGMVRTFTAVNNYEWQEVLEYTVPTGYDLNCVMFDAWSGTANEKARVIYKAAFGSFVGATNTFTDGEAWTLPKYAARVYLYVTTAIGSGANDDITITYTNQAGTTGRTATATFTKSSLAGTRIEVTLQAGDYGVVDITNVTHSATGQAGSFNIEGDLGIFYLVLSTPNVGYITPAFPVASIVVPQGGKVYLQYQANAATAVQRRLNLTGSLIPR